MPCDVRLTAQAARQLADLPVEMDARVRARIASLADEPRPPGAVKLQGAGDYYRVWEGDYRVVYELIDQVLGVVVVRVAHRREVYRNLPG